MCVVRPCSSGQLYLESSGRPDRAELAEAIVDLAPVTSICDVGSSGGPLLGALARRWPDARLVAIEPDPTGRDVGGPRYGDRVEWITACACQGLRQVEVDVVVFSHVLVHLAQHPERQGSLHSPRVGDADVAAILDAAVRAARRGIVILDTLPVLLPERWDLVRNEVTEREGWWLQIARLRA